MGESVLEVSPELERRERREKRERDYLHAHIFCSFKLTNNIIESTFRLKILRVQSFLMTSRRPCTKNVGFNSYA